MRILHVVSSYWPAFEFGGPIQSVHLLNKFLAKKGADITVYTTNSGLRNKKEITLKKEVVLDGVKVFYFPYYGYVHWTFSLALCLAVAKNIKNFDLIHITGVWNFPVFAAAFWARIYKKPYIISPRGSLMKEPLARKRPLFKRIYLSLIAKRDLEKATVIHFTTEAEKEEYLKAGLTFRKAVIIPNIVDIVVSNKSKLSKNNFIKLIKEKVGVEIPTDSMIFLSLGRINWKKGFDILIPAFAKVIKEKPKAILVVVGPDNDGYKKTVENLIKEFKLEKSVIFTDMFIDADTASAYEGSDRFVLPSYSENFGMSVMESCAHGTAVVITANVGVAPYIKNAGAGIVIETSPIDKEENIKNFAKAMLERIENDKEQEKMGEKGKHLVKTEFSPSSVAERFLKLYNELSHE